MGFALDVCNGGIFLDKEQIWHNELVAGRGRFARYLLPERPNKNYDSRPRLMGKLREKVKSGDVSKEWAESAAMREDTNTKKNNQQRISREVREEVAQAIRYRRVRGAARDLPFRQYRKTEFIHTGRLLMKQADARCTGSLADQWAQCPGRFPFYSAFVEGFVYQGYYAAAEQSKPLDRNAQADYEQLAYLTWADVVVSDDQRFFRHAFEAIWKPRGKRLETSDTFIALIERLA